MRREAGRGARPGPTARRALPAAAGTEAGASRRWPSWVAALATAAVLGAASLASAADAAGTADTADAAYHFRQPPKAGLIVPAVDLLTLRERAFIADLPVIRVGLNLPDNRPYEVITADGEISGIQIEILTHLAQSMGLRLQPVVLRSFPELLTALRERRVDLMATAGFVASREDFMTYTLGTAPNPGAIIGRQADGRFAAEPTLNGRRVAIERDYVTQYYGRRLYPEALVNDQPDTPAALRSVQRGEDDDYFGSLLMAMDRLQRDNIAGLAVKKSLVYATGQMHFGVRSDWPLLASALSKGVAALRQSPMPALQAALDAQGAPAAGLPQILPLSGQEQGQLAGRSVLRVGAVRGFSLLNEALPGGGQAGIAADYTAQVAARLGTAVDVLPFDSVAQMLDALRDGRIQIVPLLTRTPERAKEFVFSEPYLEMPYHVIARSDAPLYWDLASLRGKRLALTAQHPLREFLAAKYPDIQIVDAPPGGGAMDLVAAGQADAAVEAKLYANLRINSDNNGVLRQVARVDELPAQFHFAASREAAELIPLINRALADIPPAERERLYRRWVAVDFSPGFAWRRYAPVLISAAAALLLLAAASAWWMRRLAREVRSRTRAEQRLRDVTRSLPGLVFECVVTAQGKFEQRYLSEGIETFLGPGLHDGSGVVQAILQRIPAAQAALLLGAQADSLASQRPFKQTFCFDDLRAGPRWLHCEAVARPLPGARTAWTGYVVDVSTERALQAQLLDAVQTKNLFVASASHELRAPLQAITLALQRLGDGALDAVQRQCWQVAQDSSGALVQLIDDVLDLARFETGRVRLQPAPVKLAPLLARLIEQHRLAADERGLALHLHLAPGLPEQVSLDALRLRQLLANLIGNALKYTRQGGVTVSAGPGLAPGLETVGGLAGAPAGNVPGCAGTALAAAAADAIPAEAPAEAPAAALAAAPAAAPPTATGWLCLRVRDTGIGIAPAQLPLLFEPFGALQSRGNADEPGAERSTGLGLAICKRLVLAMQGQITLNSTPGVGTEVLLLLPLNLPLTVPLTVPLPGPATLPGPVPAPPPTPLPMATASTPGLPPPGRHGPVLLVDDDGVSRLLMAEMLRRAGYAVVEAVDAEQALACWRGQDLAAVISDRHMPGIDGLTLLGQISADAAASGRHCPRRLLCTGDADASCADAAETVLAKPVSVARLAGALAALGVMPGPTPAPAAEPAPGPALGPAPG